MFVKPRTPETVVRDPKSHVRLPAAGGRVADTSFWHRRLKCGDVIAIDPPSPAKPAKKPQATEALKESKE